MYLLPCQCRRSSGVEQLTRNEQAAGSNPIVGFILIDHDVRPLALSLFRRPLSVPKISSNLHLSFTQKPLEIYHLERREQIFYLLIAKLL